MSSGDLVLRNPITGIAGGCACAASGHAAADPAITLMKSRRRIAFPKAKNRFNVGLRHSQSNQEIGPGGIGPMLILRSSNSETRMSVVYVRGTSNRVRTFAPQECCTAAGSAELANSPARW
jgi:hypothetical protein